MTTQAFPVNCDGGLVLDKSVFVMQPGEAIRLINFEPDIGGGYAKIKGFSNSVIILSPFVMKYGDK